MKCSHCAVENMPEANFCQGCGRPFVASESTSSSPSDQAAQPRKRSDVPRTCFRCSAPLADGAKVCAGCGLDVEELFGASAPHADSQVDLRELTFFNRPPPPDPQTAALKTYGGWFAVVVLVLVGSFAAYSWLNASNVMSRLVGGGADVFSAGSVESRSAIAQSHDRQTSAVAVTRPEAPSADQLAATLSPPPQSDEARSAAPQIPSPTAVAAPAQVVAVPPPAAASSLPEAPATDSARPTVQAHAPETALLPGEQVVTAPPPQVESVEPAPKKRVVVTQIEPNKKGSGPANELDAFFRRWKKSFRQGVEDRPCTQQERALNQCN